MEKIVSLKDIPIRTVITDIEDYCIVFYNPTKNPEPRIYHPEGILKSIRIIMDIRGQLKAETTIKLPNQKHLL